MTTKGDSTRKRILDCATRLFAENGYNSVTMKDVCTATELSRGGLYRYFSSTAEMLILLMREEQSSANAEVSRRMRDNYSPIMLLNGFIEQHVRYILSPLGKLELAFGQFVQTDPRGEDEYRKRLEIACARAEEIVSYGQRAGVFKEGDAKQIAWHTMIFIGGLRNQAALMHLDKELIVTQMQMIREYIVKPEYLHNEK